MSNAIRGTLAIITVLPLFVFAPSVQADTVQARCDIYPKGQDKATKVIACTFSQRQGFVRIQRQDGVVYDLKPVGSEPGNYRDQNGKAAYRQSGLGERGHIYRLANESVYVYWDTAGLKKAQDPVTKATVVDYNRIRMEITEGEFVFRGTLKRTTKADFVGSDGRVRVTFSPNSGRVQVVNAVTKTPFYDYKIAPIFLGEDPKTMCDPKKEPC